MPWNPKMSTLWKRNRYEKYQGLTTESMDEGNEIQLYFQVGIPGQVFV